MALDKETLDAYIQALYDDDEQLSSKDYQLIINFILSNGEPETNPRDLFQVRRGDEADLPILAQGEPAITLDTEQSFYGGLNGNIPMPSKNEVGTSVKKYVNLADAVDKIGGNSVTLVISRNEVVDSNIIIPENITLKFIYPFKVTISTGFNLTINGDIEGENRVLFDGDGDVILNSALIHAIKPKWFNDRFNVANTMQGFECGQTLVGNFNKQPQPEGGYNTAMGYQSQNLAITPIGATSLGFVTLSKHTGGTYNTAIGYSSMRETTTGDYNTGVGAGSLQEQNIGDNNTALGSFAMRNTSGENNTSVGTDSMREGGTTASNNVAVGYKCLYSVEGNNNTAVGDRAAQGMATGNENTFIGDILGGALTAGSYNVSIGGQSISNKTTGDGTVAVGYTAGIGETTGSNNTYIGRGAGITGGDGSLQYATAIGYNAKVSASNAMSLGAPAGQTGTVNVGIGVAAPEEKLHVYGRVAIQQGAPEPTTHTGFATMYIDATGAFKVKLSDGTVKTVTMV